MLLLIKIVSCLQEEDRKSLITDSAVMNLVLNPPPIYPDLGLLAALLVEFGFAAFLS